MSSENSFYLSEQEGASRDLADQLEEMSADDFSRLANSISSLVDEGRLEFPHGSHLMTRKEHESILLTEREEYSKLRAWLIKCSQNANQRISRRCLPGQEYTDLSKLFEKLKIEYWELWDRNTELWYRNIELSKANVELSRANAELNAKNHYLILRNKDFLEEYSKLKEEFDAQNQFYFQTKREPTSNFIGNRELNYSSHSKEIQFQGNNAQNEYLTNKSLTTSRWGISLVEQSSELMGSTSIGTIKNATNGMLDKNQTHNFKGNGDAKWGEVWEKNSGGKDGLINIIGTKNYVEKKFSEIPIQDECRIHRQSSDSTKSQ
jgi:hypothetical protein